MNRKQILLILLILQSAKALGDVWEAPKVRQFFSENKNYMLIVYPTAEDTVKSNMESNIGLQSKNSVKIPCHAILYRINNTDTIEIWNKDLINRDAPGRVIVANDGNSIVTFDNWYYYRDGIDAMVIYGKNGELARRFNLADISPFPIEEYDYSISMIFWRCGAKYINNREIEICFKNLEDIMKQKIYNLETQDFE